MTALAEVGWEFHPSVLIGMALWTAGYVLVVRMLDAQRAPGRAPSLARQIVFHLGTLSGLLALISPLDALGDEYLFSAHMAQHLLLMFVTAPCWVVGLPAGLLELLTARRVGAYVRGLLSPAGALVVFGGAMLVWHIPDVYGLAQTHEWVHIAEHLIYIGAGMIGWWPIVGLVTSLVPVPAPPLRILYGFLLALPGTLLGAVLTFAREPLYDYYRTVPHPFGLTALADQQLAGLIMWIPAHMVVVVCLAFIGARWLNHGEARPDAAAHTIGD